MSSFYLRTQFYVQVYDHFTFSVSAHLLLNNLFSDMFAVIININAGG